MEDNNKEIAELIPKTVMDVFITMANMEPTFLGTEKLEKFTLVNRNAGAMVLSVGNRRGLIAVTLPDDLSRCVASALTGNEATNISDDELSDILGEIVNMVGGGMKMRCNETDIQISPPFSIIGSPYSLRWKTDRPTLKSRFQVDANNFEVYTCI